MKRTIAGIITVTLLAASLPVCAEHEVRRHLDRRETHQFADHDPDVWRGGRWHHGRHEGHLGWWWIVGGMWYFYPSPVYPYPDPYLPPVVVTSPTVVVEPQTSAPSQPPAQFWYYCDSAKGYYPTVQNCPEGWKSVPAQPPQTAPR